jgi:hypothetical protein
VSATGNVAVTVAMCCAACSADVRRLPARGQLAGTSIETTVDSELARYFLERQAAGATVRPDFDAMIERARSEIRGPDAAAALARIAREASADLAALVLAEALVEDGGSAALRRLYGEELRGGARGGPAAVDASRFTLLFAPGWLYRSHPETGAGFERQLALAAEMGIDAERIETGENATVEDNARLIAEDLRRRAASGRRYVVVSASKAGPEVALALAMLSREEGARHVRTSVEEPWRSRALSCGWSRNETPTIDETRVTASGGGGSGLRRLRGRRASRSLCARRCRQQRTTPLDGTRSAPPGCVGGSTELAEGGRPNPFERLGAPRQ